MHQNSRYCVWILSIVIYLMSLYEVQAEMVEKPIAVFAGLDKVTARVSSFEIPVGEMVQFGSLHVMTHVCLASPPTELTENMAFIVVDTSVSHNDKKRIFSGWIFSSSPGLHAVEHPIFDVWLTGCKSNSLKK